MLPSCFRNPTADHHRRPSLITCTYRTTLFNSPTLLTLTWSKTPNSHTVTLHSPDLFTFTIALSSPPLSLFRARPGSKSIGKLKVYWDFTRAEFDRVDSSQPGSCFYLALARGGRVEFFLGDRRDELTRLVGSIGAGVDSAESTQVSRREHVFGRRSYAATMRFSESRHEVEIECAGGRMKVKIDGKTGLVVKRLRWKFRGNEKILIGGLEVDFSWDVFDWVSAGDHNGDDRKRSGGHGVFVFQVGDGGGPLPEMVGPEKKLMRKSSAPATAGDVVSPAPSWSLSVSQWAEESTDCGRSSGWGSNSNSSESWGGGGFSLVLYAWRRE